MAYVGKYIDRNPNMISAGLPTRTVAKIEESFDNYHIEEAAESILKTDCKIKQIAMMDTFPRTPIRYPVTVKEIIGTDLTKSQFAAFRERFFENMFFKTARLGKVAKMYSKPADVTNTSRTFGCVPEKSEPAYSVILPPKDPIIVNQEFKEGHDKYVISHRHYFPSEKINRKYNKNFNPSSYFGTKRPFENSGRLVRSCLISPEEDMILSKSQMDFYKRKIPPLGAKFKSYGFPVPQDMTYGVITNNAPCNVQALLENHKLCKKNVELYQAIEHINKMRRFINDEDDIHIFDLLSALENEDPQHTGYLPLNRITDMARSLRIDISVPKFRTALRQFGLIVDECLPTERCNYEEVCRLLTIQLPLPKIGNISGTPRDIVGKKTAYVQFCEDTMKTPVEAPPIPNYMLLKQAEPTTARDIISPDIAMNFGLGKKDFAKLYEKDILQRIFQNLLQGPQFETVWQQAIEKYKEQNGLMSVTQLREVMCAISNV